MRNLRPLIPITERMRKLLPRTSISRTGLCALLLAPVLLTGVQACTDLDENPTSAITPDKFYRTEAEIRGGQASVYNSLRAPLWGYYNMSQITTPVTESMATASPMAEMMIRPGMPKMRPECTGNCICRNRSPAARTGSRSSGVLQPHELGVAVAAGRVAAPGERDRPDGGPT